MSASPKPTFKWDGRFPSPIAFGAHAAPIPIKIAIAHNENVDRFKDRPPWNANALLGGSGLALAQVADTFPRDCHRVGRVVEHFDRDPACVAARLQRAHYRNEIGGAE